MKCPTWTSVRIISKVASSSLCLSFFTRKIFFAIGGNHLKQEMLTRKSEMKEMGCKVSKWIVTTQN